jgi:hypothetical protein
MGAGRRGKQLARKAERKAREEQARREKLERHEALLAEHRAAAPARRERQEQQKLQREYDLLVQRQQLLDRARAAFPIAFDLDDPLPLLRKAAITELEATLAVSTKQAFHVVIDWTARAAHLVAVLRGTHLHGLDGRRICTISEGTRAVTAAQLRTNWPLVWQRMIESNVAV